MSVKKLLIVVLALTCLPAGTLAQGLGVTVDMGVQRSFNRELGGLSIGVQVGHSTGGFQHTFGLRGTVDMGGDLDCLVAADGSCLNSVREPALVTLSYEPRFFMAARSAPLRPFVGGTIGVARGWDGFGAAGGLSYGLHVRGPGQAVVAIGGATQRFLMGPAGPDGNDLDYWVTGAQLGIGWGF